MLWKCCTQYASKFGKLSSGHRTGKGQFSFQFQRKTMPKNAQNYCTIALISHASKVMLKILQSWLQQYVNRELPDVQAGFRKGRGTRDQIARKDPASGSFPMSWFFTSDGLSIGVSASASVLPMNTQDWSHLGWTGWTFLQSKGFSRVFSNTTVQKHQFFGAQLSL